MERFKAGDIVLLKSGSPAMTVTNVIEGISTPQKIEEMPTIKNIKAAEPWGAGTKKGNVKEAGVYCKWFIGNVLEKDSFPPEALIKVSKG